MGNADKKRVASESDGSPATCLHPNSPTSHSMAPNRNDFEKHLCRLNNITDNIQTQMKKYWNDTRREEINQQREIISSLQQAFNRDSIDERRLSTELDELQTKHTNKQREVREIEDTDMTYKNLSQAQQKLALAEARYNKQNFANVREEKLQVAEIDRIKRNIAKLAKYLPLLEERKTLESAIKEIRLNIRSIRSKMRSNREQIYDCRKKVREIKAPYIELKNRFLKLNEEKRQIIKQYEQDRQNYMLWLQQNNARAVATISTAVVQDDYDDFEPFFAQKKTCAKLIRYLRSLKREVEPVSSESHILSSETESSADEFPDSFKLLKVNANQLDGQPKETSGYSRKKNYVKKYVKKTLPITHSIDYIKLFNDISVDFPVNYAEIDEKIEKVQEALTFYNDQTNLSRLEEAERADSPFSSMLSHNGSDLMNSSYLSPRSESSSSLVIIEDEVQQLANSNSLDFHFPKIRNVNSSRDTT